MCYSFTDWLLWKWKWFLSFVCQLLEISIFLSFFCLFMFVEWCWWERNVSDSSPDNCIFSSWLWKIILAWFFTDIFLKTAYQTRINQKLSQIIIFFWFLFFSFFVSFWDVFSVAGIMNELERQWIPTTCKVFRFYSS